MSLTNTESSVDELIEFVTKWAIEKGIVNKENVPKQIMKVMEELGETCQAILKNKEIEIIDGIGDVFVTLIILCAQLNLNPLDCLKTAYNEIKDRTGKTVDGVFIKTTDL